MKLKLILLTFAVCLESSALTDNPTSAKEGELCGGFNEATGLPFPLCDTSDDLWCKLTSSSTPGAQSTCVKGFAKEGETCEGFNENNGAPFAKCGAGLVCQSAQQFSIPGAGNVCVKASPAPTDGCRAPGDIFEGVSCDSCCEQKANDCLEKSGDDWYNSARTLGGECPELCPKCAPCTIREEETLLAMTPPDNCDPTECATMDIGVDPCFSFNSCECFCDTANHLLRTCPQAKPDWLPSTTTSASTTVIVTDTTPPTRIPVEITDTTLTTSTQALSTQLVLTTTPGECTVDIARENTECPVATCAISETMKATCSTGSIELLEEIASDRSQCCLKLCNYQCVDDSGKSVLAEGDVCCVPEADPDCTSICDEGLKCTALADAPEPTCMVDLDQIETVTWTMQGPWDIKSIQDESPSLVSIFSQTLGISPFSTALSVSRFQGIVQIAFTTTAPRRFLKPLKKDPMFRPRFQANIIQANPDLASAMFLNTNEVQAMYVLEGPWSISAVQDFEEDLKSQFAFALQMNPDQIEEEITTQNKVVQVIYKCKGTARQIVPLYDASAFTSRFRDQIMQTNPALSQVIGVAACPVAQPLMGAKCAGRQTCEYGQECCCGKCFPSMIFMCDDGKWEAMFSDACDSPASFDCVDQNVPAMPKGTAALKPGLLRSSKTESPKSDSSWKHVYVHLTLLVIFGVMLGIFLGLICHRCQKEVSSQNDLTKDLTRYQDISLDTRDLGSV